MCHINIVDLFVRIFARIQSGNTSSYAHFELTNKRLCGCNQIMVSQDGTLLARLDVTAAVSCLYMVTEG